MRRRILITRSNEDSGIEVNIHIIFIYYYFIGVEVTVLRKPYRIAYSACLWKVKLKLRNSALYCTF